MKKAFLARISLLAALVALGVGVFTSVHYAQDAQQAHPKPMFKTLAPRYWDNVVEPPTSTVTNWSGSFTYLGHRYTFTMVGTNPSTTNTATTITPYIIPIKIVVAGNTYDPETTLSNGQTVVDNVTASPIFNSGITYIQGGTNIGNTQYEDAFQRGNFWKDVVSHHNYHVLFATPIVLPEQTLNVPNNDGSIGNPFGFGNVGLVNINYFDAQLQSIITSMSAITPNSFPIAVTYNVYLSENSGLSGCCIGGYHSDFGNASAPQTYSHFTYIPDVGQFSQDVSALSHEAGEWIDDPFISNNTVVKGGCGGLLEVGDPLETLRNFGAFPYTLNGFTYHLQDLVFLDYFGGPTNIPVNRWFTFQNEKSSACS